MEDFDVLKDEIKVKLGTITDRSDCIATAFKKNGWRLGTTMRRTEKAV